MSQSLTDQYKQRIVPFFNSTPIGQYLILDGVNGKMHIIVNLDDIIAWDKTLGESLISDAMKAGVEAIKSAYEEAIMNYSQFSVNASLIEIGLTGECIPLVQIRDIASEHIGKLIKIRGLVNRITQIKPFYVEVAYRCKECGELFPSTVPQINPFTLIKPFGKCEGCKSIQFEPAFEYSKFIDSQEFSVQELHEEISGTSIPTKLTMVAFKKYLMNMVDCGNLLEVIGVVKLKNVMKEHTASRFNIPYLEVVHIDRKTKDPEKIDLTKEDIEKIRKVAENDDVFDILTDNLAPSLYGLKRAKEACLLALFGGVEKIKKDITIRGNINILLLGDPSTGKSQLLRTVTDLTMNGIYATGQGTSAAGLTAALTKDEFSGEWTINAGVLVLADKGVACIDEMDKMNSDDRVNIHEAMEQQTVSISKAGIHATLNARTSVIAAANPVLGRYDNTKSIHDNIPKFPPTLLNRFDLIFILIDEPNQERDIEIMKHVSPLSDEFIEDLNRDLFAKYIIYSKRIKPKWTYNTNEKIKDYFLEIRKGIINQGKEEKIPITPRQAEALYRITEAHARACLREEVIDDDVVYTIGIFTEFLKGINFDVTGLCSGKSKNLTELEGVFYNLIEEYKDFTEHELMILADHRNINKDNFHRFWKQYFSNGKIYLNGKKGLEDLYHKV